MKGRLRLLEISTLGGLTINYDNSPVTGLASRKAEALLIYLACTGRPHAREVLADLLWDDRPLDRALSNLRVLLTSLRRELSAYLSIDRQTVAFNQDSAHRLDVAELESGLTAAHEQRSQSSALSAEAVAQLAQTLTLYQGDFLHGFYLRGCQDFEEWLLLERERLRLRVIEAQSELVAAYLALGEYRAGIEQAKRSLKLDPLREKAHRQLMQVLTLNGQRSAALTQYETCREVLAGELGVEPSAETTALYERIRAGELSRGPTKRQDREKGQPAPVTIGSADPISLSTAISQDRKNQLILLDKVKNFWVEGVLEKSLLDAGLIDLARQPYYEAIDHPWDTVVDPDVHDSRPIPATQTMLDIFLKADRADPRPHFVGRAGSTPADPGHPEPGLLGRETRATD
ncbi:MAG: BTAD domain-containing putative transcriptional regulator [Anaerolineae bacterium]|nr:BTAD domain-containing putative transcriptional regulator [Anaerolineae bacterium]